MHTPGPHPPERPEDPETWGIRTVQLKPVWLTSWLHKGTQLPAQRICPGRRKKTAGDWKVKEGLPVAGSPSLLTVLRQSSGSVVGVDLVSAGASAKNRASAARPALWPAGHIVGELQSPRTDLLRNASSVTCQSRG